MTQGIKEGKKPPKNSQMPSRVLTVGQMPLTAAEPPGQASTHDVLTRTVYGGHVAEHSIGLFTLQGA